MWADYVSSKGGATWLHPQLLSSGFGGSLGDSVGYSELRAQAKTGLHVSPPGRSACLLTTRYFSISQDWDGFGTIETALLTCQDARRAHAGPPWQTGPCMKLYPTPLSLKLLCEARGARGYIHRARGDERRLQERACRLGPAVVENIGNLWRWSWRHVCCITPCRTLGGAEHVVARAASEARFATMMARMHALGGHGALRGSSRVVAPRTSVHTQELSSPSTDSLSMFSPGILRAFAPMGRTPSTATPTLTTEPPTCTKTSQKSHRLRLFVPRDASTGECVVPEIESEVSRAFYFE